MASTPSSDLKPTAAARREGERRPGGLLGPPSRPAATRRGELLGKVALALGLAFLVLSALVAARLLMGLDEFGYAHFVPSASSDPATTNVAERLVAYHFASINLGAAVRLPASALPSVVCAAAICGLLWRRSRALAVLVGAAFVIANLVELLGKVAITRPELHVVLAGVPSSVGFHHSFPSGHAARAMILATGASLLWPRLWPLFLAWVVAVVLTLEIDGIHLLSDLAGGLLLGGALILGLFSILDARGPEIERALAGGGRPSR